MIVACFVRTVLRYVPIDNRDLLPDFPNVLQFVMSIPPPADYSATFSAVTFKNFKDPLKALHESHWVLKPAGTALLVDMNADVSDCAIDQRTQEMDVHGLESLFMRITFKHFLRRGAYNKQGCVNLVNRTSFKAHDIEVASVAFKIFLRK